MYTMLARLLDEPYGSMFVKLSMWSSAYSFFGGSSCWFLRVKRQGKLLIIPDLELKDVDIYLCRPI